MEEGIYEILLNNELLDNIDESKFFVGKSKLRPNNARKLLLNYLSDVTERALDTINENDIDVDFEDTRREESYTALIGFCFFKSRYQERLCNTTFTIADVTEFNI